MRIFRKEYESGKSHVLLVACIGLIVAVGTFLIAFITNQKAQTPKPYSNLRIPEIKIPTPPPVDPLIAPAPIITQNELLVPEETSLESDIIELNPSPEIESSPSST